MLSFPDSCNSVYKVVVAVRATAALQKGGTLQYFPSKGLRVGVTPSLEPW